MMTPVSGGGLHLPAYLKAQHQASVSENLKVAPMTSTSDMKGALV